MLGSQVEEQHAACGSVPARVVEACPVRKVEPLSQSLLEPEDHASHVGAQQFAWFHSGSVTVAEVCDVPLPHSMSRQW